MRADLAITAPPEAPARVDLIAVPPQLVTEPPASASMLIGAKPGGGDALALSTPTGPAAPAGPDRSPRPTG